MLRTAERFVDPSKVAASARQWTAPPTATAFVGAERLIDALFEALN